ncbi:DoxX family protein [Georgenia muralis]|uniref:Thiosulfate dehydrogenase [quinone] large subunit n=1 Tax=Georgenia muralis TaxID=154117 RepID=A0A3N4Z1M5_9MICO|nr:DoxX family protein [Georgenia muralis]RPF25714.1 thiosulfate dehydrogenase [quinone] large subunit [Georgenia muralis]
MATATPNRTAAGTTMFQEEIVTSSAVRKTLAVGRIIIGWTFLWAFVDKLFGLGFATPSERAWINGGSPAQGYMSGIEGPFAGLFQVFANPVGDFLFMFGLAGIGIAMVVGAGLKIAAVGGSLLLFFMYLSQFPAALGGTNPITTSHWLEAAALVISAVTLSGDTWGLGKWWAGKVGNGWLR